MDIRGLILRILKQKGEIKTAQVIKATGFSRAYVNRFFKALQDEGKIILVGKANTARYIPYKKDVLEQVKRGMVTFHSILTNEGLAEDLILNEIKKRTSVFLQIQENVSHIVDYAFTEMLNNAIEHSQSKKIEVVVKKDPSAISFQIIDKGIGIFNSIMQKRNLANHMEAIQDLLKGKLTTAPESHSGEGIFFTSKAAGMLIIQSSRKKLIFNNLLDDIFIKDIKNYIGTKVFFSISSNSKKSLPDIFKNYTRESFEFSKTQVIIRLYKMGTEYISRSQARRVLSGLEKFKTIALDFSEVDTVGQGFADEIFRIWKSHYPEIEITPINANENINFMIARAKGQ
jgi:anti-sigma regulatory factor (Ser/Thr protein kinase)